MGMELRPWLLAREWSRLGHRTTVLLGGYSHLRKSNPVLPQDCFLWREDGVEFLGLRTPRYRSNGADRALNVLTFVRKLLYYAPLLAGGFSPDVVIASSTHPFDFRAAQKIARLCGAATVFELHDIWPMSLIELHGFSQNHPLMRLIDRAACNVFLQADAVASMLPQADRYLLRRGVLPEHFWYLPNGALEADGLPPGGHIAAIRTLKERFGIVAAYAGGFSAANAVEQFVQLAAAAPEIGFVCIGDGPLRGTLEREGHSENLLLLDAVTPAALPALLREADILWLGMRPLGVYRYGLAMNKLFCYLQAGRPILLTAPPWADNPVARAGCGVVAPSDAPRQTRAALRRLAALDPLERERMGERGRRYFERHHSIEAIARDYQKRLEELRK